MYKQKKIYLGYYVEGPFNKIWEEWYSLVVKGFQKFLEDLALSAEKPLDKYGKKVSRPPSYKCIKKDKKSIIRDAEIDYTHIFYPQEWTTDSFYKIVSEFHPSLHKYLIDINFTLEYREIKIDENSVIELQNLIQESLFQDSLEKIKQLNVNKKSKSE